VGPDAVWPARGNIYAAALPDGATALLVVSSDSRNQNWPNVICSRVVISEGVDEVEKISRQQDTVVALGDLEPVRGLAYLDILYTLKSEDVTRGRLYGKITPNTMSAVNRALISAFDLPPFEFFQD
jgi:mRNA-degrading endonuclease toxin of MazEF toxin-antitoxin module